MSDYNTIFLSKSAGVARVTLNRPGALNALNPDMLDELLSALEEIENDYQLNVLILTGAGRIFSSGVDIKSGFFMENLSPEEKRSAYTGLRLLEGQHRLIMKLHTMPQVTMASMNGDAIGGGGFGMALACDMRFCVPEARFWLIPMQVNVIQDFGATWFLERLVGVPKTCEMLFSGKPVPATEAERLGIVNRVIPADRLDEEVAAFAAGIGKAAPDAVRLAKRSIYAGVTTGLFEQLHNEAVANGLNFLSGEFQEASAAYLARLRKKG